MSPLAARLSIALAALLWSTGGAAIKSVGLDAPAIAGGRALFAAVALFALIPGARQRPTRGSLLTALAYAATCILFVFANRLTSAATAIFIQNTAPVWVMLLGARLLGERATRAELWSVPVSLAGCLLFFLGDFYAGHASGNLAAFLASFTYAYLIIRYRQQSSSEGLSSAVLGNVIIVITMAPLAWGGPAPTSADVLAIAYLGVIQQAAAVFLFIRGVATVSALEAALLTLLEPMMSPVWAFFLVDERPGLLAVLGAVLILAAAVARTIAAQRRPAST